MSSCPMISAHCDQVDQNSSALVASSSVDMIRSDPILNEARLNQRKMKFVVQR